MPQWDEMMATIIVLFGSILIGGFMAVGIAILFLYYEERKGGS